MIRKSLLTAALLMPLIALSGMANAGPQWNPTMAPWKSAQSPTQTGPSVVSKPYARFVAPEKDRGGLELRYQGGPKSPFRHYERR